MGFISSNKTLSKRKCDICKMNTERTINITVADKKEFTIYKMCNFCGKQIKNKIQEIKNE